jgi:hypothetical protein
LTRILQIIGHSEHCGEDATQQKRYKHNRSGAQNLTTQVTASGSSGAVVVDTSKR